MQRAHSAADCIIRCIPSALGGWDEPAWQTGPDASEQRIFAQGTDAGALAINYALETVYMLDITSKEHKKTAQEGLWRIGRECVIGRSCRLTARDDI
jgi:hypothetical protein